MTKLTRRSFLKETSAGAAALSLLPAIPALAGVSKPPKTQTVAFQDAFAGPMMVHVTDAATSEITLLVDAREIVFRDPELVARLRKAAS